MEFCEVNIETLNHDPKNPRTHSDDNFKAIKNSISAHGQVEPLVVQKSSNMVIAGNARLKVLKDLQYRKVKIVKLDVNDSDARKLSISLNRSGELASWNEAILASHLEALSAFDSAFDSESLGFSNEQMEELVAAFGGTIEELDFGIPEPEQRKELKEDDSEFEFSEEDSDEDFEEEEVNIRMVQLFFNDTNFPEFQSKVKAIADKRDFKTITDAVFFCVNEIYKSLD